jgi:hypothetical protein
LRAKFDLEQALERSEFSPEERKPTKTCISIKTANEDEGMDSPPPLALTREMSFFVLKEREQSFFSVLRFFSI